MQNAIKLKKKLVLDVLELGPTEKISVFATR